VLLPWPRNVLQLPKLPTGVIRINGLADEMPSLPLTSFELDAPTKHKPVLLYIEMLLFSINIGVFDIVECSFSGFHFEEPSSPLES
jgi:hypothetical protein